MPPTRAAEQRPNLQSRADRLHALFKRNNRRFRDAYCAARLAGEQLERIGPKHPDWNSLRSLEHRAMAALMEGGQHA